MGGHHLGATAGRTLSPPPPVSLQPPCLKPSETVWGSRTEAAAKLGDPPRSPDAPGLGWGGTPKVHLPRAAAAGLAGAGGTGEGRGTSRCWLGRAASAQHCGCRMRPPWGSLTPPPPACSTPRGLAGPLRGEMPTPGGPAHPLHRRRADTGRGDNRVAPQPRPTRLHQSRPGRHLRGHGGTQKGPSPTRICHEGPSLPPPQPSPA